MKLELAYEVRTSAFSGFVRPQGRYHGLVLTHDQRERVITRPGMCFANLEHYTAAGRPGLFVPRDVCHHSHTAGDDWIKISFSPAPAWRLCTTLRYAFRSDDTIDVEYRFQFNEDFGAFEAFIASYMPAGTIPPLIRMDGRWVRPQVNGTPREQLFVPRDKLAGLVAQDGRWQPLCEMGFSIAVHEGTYDIPVMVTTFAGGLAAPVLIQMVDAHECAALSPNVFAPAHDFSLGGYDVLCGQETIARARIIYRQIANLSEAEQLYAVFWKERP